MSLSDEAKNLIDYLDIALENTWEYHPLAGRVVRKGTGPRRRKLRETRAKAWRRYARRRFAEGNPLPVQGAAWLINAFDSSYF